MKSLTRMPCPEVLEKLVACARRRVEPDPSTAAHLRACAECGDRWQAERQLTAHLRILRVEAAGQRSPEAARTELMRRFAARHENVRSHRWLWSAAAAAVVLLALLPLRDFDWKPTPAVADVEAGAIEGYDDFIPVPYVPPLASGEMVRVVHTELYPAALASLGVRVDPAWTTELPADLLMGQDGFPRAVRVSVDPDDQGF